MPDSAHRLWFANSCAKVHGIIEKALSHIPKIPSILVCKACPLEGAQGSCFFFPRVTQNWAAHPAQIILPWKTKAAVTEFEVPAQRCVSLFMHVTRAVGTKVAPTGDGSSFSHILLVQMPCPPHQPGLRSGRELVTGSTSVFLGWVPQWWPDCVSLSRKFLWNSESFKTQGEVYSLWLSKSNQLRKGRPSSMIWPKVPNVPSVLFLRF